ncbi:MAG: DUF4124 domain-containing protein [Rhodocyclaceae bacterium]|nr:DUF4124 domain-containing protein [Rhodocyclaceae bacterium]
MKNTLIFALGIALTVTLPNAGAETYQWKDSSGRTVVSDTPPQGVAKETARTIGSNAPLSTSAAKPADAPKTMAEKDLEFRKRQQESAEKADKAAKEESDAAAKRDNCERAKRQVALLESGQRIATTDANGERRVIDDEERARELARAQKIVGESCK